MCSSPARVSPVRPPHKNRASLLSPRRGVLAPTSAISAYHSLSGVMCPSFSGTCRLAAGSSLMVTEGDGPQPRRLPWLRFPGKPRAELCGSGPPPVSDGNPRGCPPELRAALAPREPRFLRSSSEHQLREAFGWRRALGFPYQPGKSCLSPPVCAFALALALHQAQPSPRGCCPGRGQ